jgi:L-fuconolactonase
MSRSSALWDVAEELDVPVCVQLHAWQVPALVVLARARPGLTFVIDSMPAASLLDVHRRTWLRAAAGCPNIRIKVLCGAPDSAEAHPFRDLWPFAAAAVEIFGSARVMLGSDFPYVENVAGYGQALTWLDGSATMAAADRSSLRGGTAATIWPSLCETSSTSPTP